MSTEKSHLGGCIISNDIGTWAPQVWDALIEKFKIKSMVDVGCGAGHSLKYFIDKNIEGIGIEGFIDAIESSPVKSHIKIHDYTEAPYILEKTYDLAWCCEFVEHVEEQYSANFMKTFEGCKLVAMTHALPGQPGFHHVNCQVADFWIDKFKKSNFSYEESLSLNLRSLLPIFAYRNNRFENEHGEVGKFENVLDPFLPNGSHVKNTLMVFKNEALND
jgi:hypothetical protein